MRKHRYFWLQIGHDNLDVFSDVRTEVFFSLKNGKFSGFFLEHHWFFTIWKPISQSSWFKEEKTLLLMIVIDWLPEIKFLCTYTTKKSNWIRLFLQFLPIFFWLYVIIFQVHLAQNPDFRYPIHLYLIVELMLLELKQLLSSTDHDWLDLFIDQNYTPPMLKSFSKDEDQGLSRHKYVYTIHIYLS